MQLDTRLVRPAVAYATLAEPAAAPLVASQGRPTALPPLRGLLKGRLPMDSLVLRAVLADLRVPPVAEDLPVARRPVLASDAVPAKGLIRRPLRPVVRLPLAPARRPYLQSRKCLFLSRRTRAQKKVSYFVSTSLRLMRLFFCVAILALAAVPVKTELVAVRPNASLRPSPLRQKVSRPKYPRPKRPQARRALTRPVVAASRPLPIRKLEPVPTRPGLVARAVVAGRRPPIRPLSFSLVDIRLVGVPKLGRLAGNTGRLKVACPVPLAGRPRLAAHRPRPERRDNRVAADGPRPRAEMAAPVSPRPA